MRSFINSKFCWLSASPDRVVHGASNAEELLEVKCPFSARDCSLVEFAAKRGSCLQLVSDSLRLKRNHNYYFQVLGQVGVCGKSWCDFVVWSPTEMFTERIFYQDTWLTHLEKLTEFYFQHVLPLLR